MNWEQKRFSQIVTIAKGEAITRASENEGPYPVILGSQEPAYYIDRYNHEGEAIVISRSGASAGYASFWNEPIFITDGYLVEPTAGNHRKYIYYLLKYFGKALRDLQNGAAIPHVTPKTINKLKVPIPPLNMQRRVADVLSAYDNLIEVNYKRIKLLEQMAENLYKEWFVRFRFPGHENTEFENGIPKGWKYKRFEEVFDYVRGVSYSSEEIDCDEGENLINLKNIQGFGGFRKDGTKKYSGEHRPEQTVRYKDLVMGVTDMTQDRRTVGAVALVPNIRGIISADLIKLNSSIDNVFSYCMFRWGFYSTYISQFGNGANVIHLKPVAVKNAKLLIPSDKMMKLFSDLVNPIVDHIESLNGQTDNLIKQRDLLLPRLMSGKLEV